MPTQDTATLLETRRFRVVITQEPEAGGKRREVIRHPGAVAVLPLLDDGRVCLVRNRRLSVDQELIELPAGTLEPGEDPQATALRELAEETGFQAEVIQQIHAFFLSPGILDERMHLFVAQGLRPGKANLQPDEEIHNLLVPWDEAVQMALDGRIHDAKTLIGLLYYDRTRIH
jgi:ADP-ribose pyrophosphatase